jgi:hypothetical protein
MAMLENPRNMTNRNARTKPLLECLSPPRTHIIKSSKVCAKRTATSKPAQQAPAEKQKTSALEAAIESPI